MSQLRTILCAFLFSLISLVPRSAEAAGWTLDAMPTNLDQVDIYLHTIDVGNLIYNNFGHTALRVHDKLSGQDLVFNWGIFDFKNPVTFSLDFYRGILIYQLGVYPNRLAMNIYAAERRKVWEDRLNLNNEQKRILLERLVWNAKPENRSYAYQYFFDNCSTRIRDYLNEALDGMVKRSSELKFTSQSFRDMVFDGYSLTPSVDLMLDITMNSNIDRIMTEWEKMFHPIALREFFIQQPIRGEEILLDRRILYDFTRPESYPGLSFVLVFMIFAVPLSLLGICFYLKVNFQKFGSHEGLLYRLLAIFSLPLLGLGALLGVLLPLSWAVSAHLDLHHNANILLFWPFDFILLAMVWKISRQGRAYPLSRRGLTLVRAYLILHMSGTLLLPVLRILGFIQQNVDRISVWILPPYLLILFLLWRVGIQPAPLAEETKKAA